MSKARHLGGPWMLVTPTAKQENEWTAYPTTRPTV